MGRPNLTDNFGFDKSSIKLNDRKPRFVENLKTDIQDNIKKSAKDHDNEQIKEKDKKMNDKNEYISIKDDKKIEKNENLLDRGRTKEDQIKDLKKTSLSFNLDDEIYQKLNEDETNLIKFNYDYYSKCVKNEHPFRKHIDSMLKIKFDEYFEIFTHQFDENEKISKQRSSYKHLGPINIGKFYEKLSFKDDEDKSDIWTRQATGGLCVALTVSEMYSQEVILIRSLCHPNIAAAFAFVHTYNATFEVFFDYYPLKDLHTAFNKYWNPYNDTFILFCSSQLLMAIEYLHALKIAHLNIKPKNICFNIRGYLKLIDFTEMTKIDDEKGLKRLLCSDYTPVNYEEIICGLSVDIWSLGAILYEMHSNKKIKNQLKGSQVEILLYGFDDKVKEVIRRTVFIDQNTEQKRYSSCPDYDPSIFVNENSRLRPTATELRKNFSYFQQLTENNWKILFFQQYDVERVTNVKLKEWFDKIHSECEIKNVMQTQLK